VEDPVGVATGEFPMYGDSIAIDSSVPGAAFSLQKFQTWNPPLSRTLAGEKADFDFRLLEPAGVLGRVGNREALPQCATVLRAKMIDQDLPRVRAQVVEHERNRSSQRLWLGQGLDRPGELRPLRFGVGQGKCRPASGGPRQNNCDDRLHL